MKIKGKWAVCKVRGLVHGTGTASMWIIRPFTKNRPEGYISEHDTKLLAVKEAQRLSAGGGSVVPD